MHYLALVLIPPDSKDVYVEVERLLAPYDCELEFEEYETECHCGSDESFLEPHDEASQIAGRWADIRFTHDDEHPERRDRRVDLINREHSLTEAEQQELQELSAEFSEAYAQTYEAYNRALWDAQQRLAAQPFHPVFDPDCEDCHGSGRIKSTDNPNAHYDYWSIGGRFCGRWAAYLKPAVESAQSGLGVVESTATPVSLLERLGLWWRTKPQVVATPDPNAIWEKDGDVIPVQFLLKECPTPCILVTPDGEWHEREECESMPIAVKQAANAAWNSLCRQLYEANATCKAVICDIHF